MNNDFKGLSNTRSAGQRASYLAQKPLQIVDMPVNRSDKGRLLALDVFCNVRGNDWGTSFS